MDTENTQQFQALPKSSEPFGSVPHHSESFGNVPNISERTENHILTVRQVARMFEDAVVPRTERSITNWCKRDASGVSRLDAFFDINERKYFITAESVERAIAEEKAKTGFEPSPNLSEPFGTFPKESTKTSAHPAAESSRPTEDDSSTRKDLEQQIMDLKILNAGKDFFIKQLQDDRAYFQNEQKVMIEQLVSHSRTLGQLETRLLQVEAPKNHTAPVTHAAQFDESPVAQQHPHAPHEELPPDRDSISLN